MHFIDYGYAICELKCHYAVVQVQTARLALNMTHGSHPIKFDSGITPLVFTAFPGSSGVWESPSALADIWLQMKAQRRSEPEESKWRSLLPIESSRQ